MPAAWARAYAVLFFLVGAFGVGHLAWREIRDGGPPVEVAYDIVVGAGRVGIGAASLGVIVVLGGDLVVVISTWFKQRERAKGREERQALWEAWNERRLEAEAKGQPFDEPPPQSPNGRSDD